MNPSDSVAPQLTQIAAYFMAKREAIFNTWRSKINADPTLLTAKNLTRAEFNDQMPLALNALEKRLRKEAQPDDLATIASEHGLHRWHKGYKLSELLSELAHLHATLNHEVEIYRSTHAEIDPDSTAQVYQLISTWVHDTVQASALRYSILQQQEAGKRADDLERALTSLSELTNQRSDLLRQVSHDLRVYFGLMTTSSQLLKLPGPEEDQSQLREMWQQNLTNTTTLLTELMDLSRLEAGQESFQCSEFDGGVLLTELAERVQPVAQQQQIRFEWAGPANLPLQGDHTKLERIVQNLLINALKHTQGGLVTLSWSQEDASRWVISVQDDGLGLPEEIMKQLGQDLSPTVESTGVLRDTPLEQEATVQRRPNSVRLDQKGEGIGLMIVKRLCEVIGANLDIESQPGVGTIFRIVAPMQYVIQG